MKVLFFLVLILLGCKVEQVDRAFIPGKGPKIIGANSNVLYCEASIEDDLSGESLKKVNGSDDPKKWPIRVDLSVINFNKKFPVILETQNLALVMKPVTSTRNFRLELLFKKNSSNIFDRNNVKEIKTLKRKSFKDPLKFTVFENYEYTGNKKMFIQMYSRCEVK